MSARETIARLARTVEDLRELSDLAAQVGDMKLSWLLQQAANFVASAQAHIWNRMAGRPSAIPDRQYQILIPATAEEATAETSL